MKPTRFLPLIALIALWASAAAQAQPALSTTSATVSATILDTCKFASPGSALVLNMGGIDPSDANLVRRSLAIDFFCTNGFAFKVGLQGITGDPTLLNGVMSTLTHKGVPSNTMPYKLQVDMPGTVGQGFSADRVLRLGLNAEIKPGDFNNALGGDYESTVVVELRP